MANRAVELRVGGQSYRVVSSASAVELERFAAKVDEKLSALVPPGRPLSPNALLLAAIALAHDAEEQRARAELISERARTAVERLLGRVDDALAVTDAALAQTVAPAEPE
jgi:cell division protein ZapA